MKHQTQQLLTTNQRNQFMERRRRQIKVERALKDLLLLSLKIQQFLNLQVNFNEISNQLCYASVTLICVEQSEEKPAEEKKAEEKVEEKQEVEEVAESWEEVLEEKPKEEKKPVEKPKESEKPKEPEKP